MNQIDISCPSCGFSRQVPADKVPAGTCTVTCPKCRHPFPFSKPAEPPQQPPTAEPPPLPPPAAEHLMTVPLQPSRPRRERPAPARTLPDIGTLFSRTWAIFQKRFATLIGLYLLAMVAFIIPPALLVGGAILAGVTKGGATVMILGAAGALVGMYIGFCCFGAFLHAVTDEELTLGEGLAKGPGIAFPLLWVGLLTGFIVAGGFLLFIIPGIIFSVWFFFAQFILVREDVHGMGALLKSREYVRGEWFNVALRLLLVWAASLLLGMVPLAGPILTIVFLPYAMIFHYLVYCDLRELKEDAVYSCGTGDLLKWPAVALAGYVIVPALTLLLIGGTVLSKFRQLSTGAATVTRPGAPAPAGGTDSTGYRVIDFPRQETPAAAGSDSSQGGQAAGAPQPQPVATDETPQNIHIFIYSVNYTGAVRANGTTLKELEGKPEVQYNYNIGGSGLKYGENSIDLDFSELPNHQSSLLEVHLRISRTTPGKGKEVLGEWRLNEKGSGTKNFTFTIPKP